MAFSEQTPAGDDRTPYALLADSHRRHALHVLRESDVPLALADLAADIARCESAASDGATDWNRIEQIRAALYHNHVPRLAERGLVEFDGDRNAVTITESTELPKGATGEA